MLKTFKVTKNLNVERYVTKTEIPNFRGDGELLLWATSYRIIKRVSLPKLIVNKISSPLTLSKL
jgi:hypothetical protein